MPLLQIQLFLVRTNGHSLQGRSGHVLLLMQYEDELLQAIAQSIMPLDQMNSSAEDAATLSAAMGEQPVRQVEDLLARELLTWFKHDFFTWVSTSHQPVHIY